MGGGGSGGINITPLNESNTTCQSVHDNARVLSNFTLTHCVDKEYFEVLDLYSHVARPGRQHSNSNQSLNYTYMIVHE